MALTEAETLDEASENFLLENFKDVEVISIEKLKDVLILMF